MDCTHCPDFSTCKELCPEAELYVGQDNIHHGKSGVTIQTKRMRSFAGNQKGNNWLEIMQTLHEGAVVPDPRLDMADFERLNKLNFSRKQLSTILRYYVWGETCADIGRAEGVSRQAIFNRLKSSVNVAINALDRRRMWIDTEHAIINNLDNDRFTKHRMVLFLYLYERMERSEIAVKLDMSPQYVWTLLDEAFNILDENVD